MPTFGTTIAYVEDKTAIFKSCTLHLGRKRQSQPSRLTDETSVEASEDDVEAIIDHV